MGCNSMLLRRCLRIFPLHSWLRNSPTRAVTFPYFQYNTIYANINIDFMRKIMQKKLLLLIFVLGTFSCTSDSFGCQRTIDIGLKTVTNGSPKILLKTRDGCSKTEFYLKTGYYDERLNDRLFIATTFGDLKNLQERYFYLPYLDTISDDFFRENYLVLILETHGGSSEFRNEKIESNANYEYILVYEYWWLGSNFLTGQSSCLITVLYVLEIPKAYN